MTSQETDFLMASVLNASDHNPTAPGPAPESPPPSDRLADRASSVQSPQSNRSVRAVIGNMGMLDQSMRRSTTSVVNVREQSEIVKNFLEDLPKMADVRSSLRNKKSATYGAYGAVSTGDEEADAMFHHFKRSSAQERQKTEAPPRQASLLNQVPAIAITSLLNLMMAIPFGVSYFPIGWSSGESTEDASGGGEDADGVSGPFPLPNKEALGIRMCLFSTLIGQIVMTFASKFESAIAFQMIENLPFFHQLAIISIANQGYGKESLSTLFFLFGLSTLMVGVVFYLLGAFDLGRVCYFFPTHVLVGCIGGIGVFIVISSIEVTNNVSFSWDMNGVHAIIDNMHLFGVVLLFEATLRLLAWKTKGRIPLLAPIYFCSIPFVFYALLWLLRVDTEDAIEAGYFFDSPPQEEGSSSQGLFDKMFDHHTFDLLRVVDFRTISWTAVYQSIGTMIALSAFSLIHVPVNIPAFSISMDLDTDMNAELIAHGYSNAAAGLFGGLPNYMTYSNSLLYAKSKGGGRISSLLVAFFTFIFFLFGPEIAAFIPRCMAGTLLLHIGLDLFLEGAVDSYESYDRLEYGGIWFIVITMTAKGMSGGLIAGVFAALSVYAAQSITYMNPIREILPATTLRSSVWTRPAAELAILNSDVVGRTRVLLVQLQGHLFFGNVTQLTDPVKKLLAERKGTDLEPLIVILDFTLVLGLDSSAAHAVAKMNSTMHSRFGVAATIFVAGRDGFPCEYALTEAVCKQAMVEDDAGDELEKLADSDASIGQSNFRRNRVCDNLDEALIFAEDCLIARQDPSLLKRDIERVRQPTGYMTPDEERRLAAQQLAYLFPRSDKVTNAATLLFSFFEREEYTKNQIIWETGSDSDCAKLVVRGELIAYTENTANTNMAAERVPVGNLVGELGMVHGLPRFNTLECTSEKAVAYSLSLDNWKKIRKEHTFAALYFEEIVIRYLAQRVQHVTNRVVESRCLPV